MKDTAYPQQNKLWNFWASMRSTRHLMENSREVSRSQLEAFDAELEDILGKRIITYPYTLRKEFGITEQTSYRVKRALFGYDEQSNPTEVCHNEIRFRQFLVKNAHTAMKHNWSWRIIQEAEDKQSEGWYPFFVTLTVDPKRCNGKPVGTRPGYSSSEELWKKGREFRWYIRQLAEVSAECLGHPPPRVKTKEYDYRPESDYVTYAGVIEHGKSMEHHHAHIMVWMKEIPSAWKVDPNQGRLPGYRNARECTHMRKYWPWSIDSQKPALYFRSKGDVWSDLGHITPIDKNGNPIKILPVSAVGNYITKYMQKGEKIWEHRMKCTRNLGLTRINRLINSLTYEELEPLTWRPQTSSHRHSASLIHSVPPGIVRSLATRRCFAILYQSREPELKNLMKTNYEHFRMMQESVRAGARPDRMGSMDFYDWVQRFLPEIQEYCEKRLLDSHRLLAYDFPRNIHKVQPIVQGGNDIGFTRSL